VLGGVKVVVVHVPVDVVARHHISVGVEDELVGEMLTVEPGCICSVNGEPVYLAVDEAPLELVYVTVK
jgi:hypothetical protein